MKGCFIARYSFVAEVTFKSKQKKFQGDLKIKLCGKRHILLKVLNTQKIDTNLWWQYHVIDLSIKLNSANPLLFKMRKYVILNY